MPAAAVSIIALLSLAAWLYLRAKWGKANFYHDAFHEENPHEDDLEAPPEEARSKGLPARADKIRSR